MSVFACFSLTILSSSSSLLSSSSQYQARGSSLPRNILLTKSSSLIKDSRSQFGVHSWNMSSTQPSSISFFFVFTESLFPWVLSYINESFLYLILLIIQLVSPAWNRLLETQSVRLVEAFAVGTNQWSLVWSTWKRSYCFNWVVVKPCPPWLFYRINFLWYKRFRSSWIQIDVNRLRASSTCLTFESFIHMSDVNRLKASSTCLRLLLLPCSSFKDLRYWSDKTGIAPASVIIRNVTLYARAKENKLNYSNLYYLNSKHWDI